MDPSTGKQKTDSQTGRPLFELVQVGTRITSTRLNTMEDGIEAAHILVEKLAKEAIGNFVVPFNGVMGLSCSAQGLKVIWTAGVAYVGGRRYEVPAGEMALNPTQGQYVYVDVDGVVKKTSSQATAKSGLSLFYVATDTSGVISTSDQRVNVSLEEIIKRMDNVQIPDASLTQKGKVQLSNSISSTNQTNAATPKAVNDARQDAITRAQAMDEETVIPLANTNAQTIANTVVNDVKNNIAANLIPNSTGSLGLIGWTNAAGNTVDFSVFTAPSATVGYYFSHNSSMLLTSDSSVLETDETITLSASDYTFQITFYTIGSPDIDMYAEIYNSSTGTVLCKIPADKNANWHKKSASFSVASVVSVKVRLAVKGIAPVATRAATRLKLSVGGNSIYTNEADWSLMRKKMRALWGGL
ncbi:tail fiber protein [Paenibacillus barcinonensis]|nr:tail fiber protein [Paenibacillus barcinonensis]